MRAHKKLDIAYKNDIISIVAKRLGLPEAKVRDIANFSFSYMHHLMDSPDVSTIELPSLGKLHLYFKGLKSSYIKSKNVCKRYGELSESCIKKKEKIDALTERGLGKRSGEGLWHRKKTWIKRSCINMGLSIEELENKQNGN